MIIEKGSDLVLRIKDSKGNGIRVANKSNFYLKVFTSDKNVYLEYTKEDIVERDDYDTVNITATKLAELPSGVIAYTYSWGVNDGNFEDGEYNRIKTIYTDFYFKNNDYTAPSTSNPTNPSNPDLQEIIDRLNQHTVTVKNNTLIITI